jgi:hypothetical protein
VVSAVHKCCAEVWKGWGNYACVRAGNYEHEGRHFCKIHHPPSVAAKNKAKSDAWEAEWKLKTAAQNTARAEAAEQKRRAELFPELLDALKRAVSTVECEYGKNSCAAYQALIAKAEGAES